MSDNEWMNSEMQNLLRKFYTECAILDAGDIAYYPMQLIGGRFAFNGPSI